MRGREGWEIKGRGGRWRLEQMGVLSEFRRLEPCRKI